MAEFELTVGTALSDLTNTLESELAEHDKRCKAMHKSTADSLKKIKAAEDKVAKQRKEFEQAAQELARKIRKDVRCPVAKGRALSRSVRSPAAREPCALPVLGGAQSRSAWLWRAAVMRSAHGHFDLAHPDRQRQRGEAAPEQGRERRGRQGRSQAQGHREAARQAARDGGRDLAAMGEARGHHPALGPGKQVRTEVSWVRARFPCAYTLTCLLGPGGVQ